MSTFLIVGGTTGIGAELLNRLVRNGHQAIVWARTANPESNTSQVQYVPVDITQDDLPEIGVPLDGLAYLPGSINLKMFKTLKPDDFRKEFELNVMGAIKTMQHALPALKLSATASIVMFSTVAVSQGMPFHSSIAASKGAIEGLTRSLAAEFAPFIRVNAIAPSLVNTPLSARLLATPEKEEMSAKRHPLGRVGQAADIAAMAEFLLTANSSWISGQVIGVDGGMSSIRI